MPYKVEKRKSKWVVYNPETSRIFGKHDTKEEAEAQQRALYVHAPEGSVKVARLDLYGDIGMDLGSGAIRLADVRKQLAVFRDDGAVGLDVHVFSGGGSVFEGLGIHALLKAWPGSKAAYVDGLAASIATVIALAADEVILSEGGAWMVHTPRGLTFGTAEDMRKTAEDLDKMHKTMLDIYVAATGRPAEEITAEMAAETWLYGEDAVKAGYVGRIAGPAAVAAVSPAVNLHEKTPKCFRTATQEEAMEHVRQVLARPQMEEIRKKFAASGKK